MTPVKEFVKIYHKYFANKSSNKLLEFTNSKEKYLFDQLSKGVDTYAISRELVNDTPSNRNFKKLKSSLYEKMLTSTVLIESGTEIQRNKKKLFKHIFAFKVLESFGFRELYVPLGKKIITKALYYHHYNEAAEISRILFNHFAVFEKNNKDAFKYYNQAVDSLAIYQQEIEYEWKYSNIRGNILSLLDNGSTESLKELSADLENVRDNGSLRLNFMYFELKYFEYHIDGDIESTIDICKSAIDYFDALSFNHDIVKCIFIIHLVDAYIQASELTRAELLLKNVLEGRSNKERFTYRFYDLLLKINLFKANKTECIDTYTYLTKNINKLTTIYDKDRFLIYSIYVGLLTNQPVNFRKINYNLNKVKQDKKGLHVPLLIGQAVYHYIHDYDKFIDKLDALKQYCYKYLKDDKYQRTNEFLRILASIGEGKDVVPNFSDKKNMIGGVEIVNYELLLEMILSKSHAT